MCEARYVVTVIAFLGLVGAAVLASPASADNGDYALYRAQHASLEKQLAPEKAKCIATQDPDACQNASVLQGEIQNLDQQDQQVIEEHGLEQLQQAAQEEEAAEAAQQAHHDAEVKALRAAFSVCYVGAPGDYAKACSDVAQLSGKYPDDFNSILSSSNTEIIPYIEQTNFQDPTAAAHHDAARQWFLAHGFKDPTRPDFCVDDAHMQGEQKFICDNAQVSASYLNLQSAYGKDQRDTYDSVADGYIQEALGIAKNQVASWQSNREASCQQSMICYLKTDQQEVEFLSTLPSCPSYLESDYMDLQMGRPEPLNPPLGGLCKISGQIRQNEETMAAERARAQSNGSRIACPGLFSVLCAAAAKVHQAGPSETISATTIERTGMAADATPDPQQSAAALQVSEPAAPKPVSQSGAATGQPSFVQNAGAQVPASATAGTAPDASTIHVTTQDQANPSGVAMSAVTPRAVPTGTEMASPPVHPSFDCALARSAVEGTICGSAELSALDSKLSGLYEAKLKSGAGAAVLRTEQRAWMHQRSACGASVTCLKQSYEERIAQLQ